MAGNNNVLGIVFLLKIGYYVAKDQQMSQHTNLPPAAAKTIRGGLK
jgi:uncharacterized protein YneF (UPF0154 family)